MPSRLRPTASIASDAILVGDPGRALLLAQELLEQPKMSNHARGLWGYYGRTPDGRELTIQATGMGGPSAAIVLADLAKLGVRRAVRVGTCAGADPEAHTGELLLIDAAVSTGGSAASFGLADGGAVPPDPELLERLQQELGTEIRTVRVASLDALRPQAASIPAGVAATDMQTVAVLAHGRELDVAAAAVLVVVESETRGSAVDDEVEAVVKRAGRAASAALST